jgi:hypothetical protein
MDSDFNIEEHLRDAAWNDKVQLNGSLSYHIRLRGWLAGEVEQARGKRKKALARAATLLAALIEQYESARAIVQEIEEVVGPE